MKQSATTLRPGTVQVVSYTTSVATTNAFASSTHQIRIVATTACHYILGAAPTATTSHTYLPADVVEYIDVSPGEKIAFIQHASGGNAYVTEVSK